MVFEYAQLRGTLDGMDTTVITELAEYYEKEIGYHIPKRTPFVGKNFNVTRAGIHADGLLKNEEIYNIVDTDKLLNRCLLYTSLMQQIWCCLLRFMRPGFVKLQQRIRAMAW